VAILGGERLGEMTLLRLIVDRPHPIGVW